MTKWNAVLIVAAAYVAVGLILWFVHDQKNVRFRSSFPSTLRYGFDWPYWEVKALTQ